MPLPTAETCDIPTDVCCTTYFDVAAGLLSSAALAYDECVESLDCPPIPRFVSVGEPTYTDQGEYLSVWLAREEPAPSRQEAARWPRPRAEFGFKLIEAGYPTLEGSGGVITAPDSDRIHILSKHSYSHIEKVRRSVYTDVTTKNLPNGVECEQAILGPLVTLPRTAGLVGFRFTLVVVLSWQQQVSVGS